MSLASAISINIPPEVAAAVRTNLEAAITALAPYVQALTPEQRKKLPKMSDKTVAFVNKVVGYTDTNPEFTPVYLDVAELKVDFNAVSVLKPLSDLANQLASNLEDTSMLSGSEAYTASLLYYNSVRGAAKQGVANAETIYDDLKTRFPGTPKKKTEQTV